MAAALVGLFVSAPAANAQSLADRIQHVRDQHARPQAVDAAQADAAARATDGLSLNDRLGAIVREVRLDRVRLQSALDWWSRVAGVPLVADWNALAKEGIDSQQRITLNLQAVPAGRLLALMLQLAQPRGADVGSAPVLMWERTPWYVEVLTRGMANRRVVTRVYIVDDLLMEVPHFDDAPSFDLSQVLSNRNAAGQGSSPLFMGDERTTTPRVSKADRGNQLAQLIRDTIEPDVWIDNGGQYASVRYFQGRLVVTAPQYVQRQIGLPSFGVADPYTQGAAALPAAGAAASRGSDFRSNAPSPHAADGEPVRGGVAAVGHADTDRIGAVRQ